MSGYDKAHAYEVYDYNQATRTKQGHDYQGFAHQGYAADYVDNQPQVPSGIPNSMLLAALPSAQHYTNPHDPAAATYYTQQNTQYPAYFESAPRQLPEVVDYQPRTGRPGSQITITFRSIYDFDQPPIAVGVMFGHKRCDSVILQKDTNLHYAATTTVPDLASTSSPSPQVPLLLTFDAPGISWDSPTLDFGHFTYLDTPAYYPSASPQEMSRKRKLSSDASIRRSPPKKPSMHHVGDISGPPPSAPSSAVLQSPFTKPDVSSAYSRRYSVPENQPSQAPYTALQRVHTHYGGQPTQTTPTMQAAQSSSYGYGYPTQSPVAASARAGSLMPSPSSSSLPALVRTSTMQSPTTPNPANPTLAQAFNPYAMYPSNTKAMLKIDGDLNKMSDNWKPDEIEAKRRLVQFTRSQSGSIITAKFEPVTPEDRLPNSICVSCIWWEERRECYVTSVDTIQLLESLVAVRFTVEEKNRIRRNLEGFRPATVSKTKADSEDFFKLIMGFPNPKPRNIEKDVKVFPWRILHTALKKIIGKYSASYSSTAGVLHAPGASGFGGSGRSAAAAAQAIEQQARAGASPPPSSNAARSYPSHSYTSTMATTGSAGLSVGPSAGPPHDLRLTMPATTTVQQQQQQQQQTTSWHQPSAHYSSDLSATGRSTGSTGWDLSHHYMNPSPVTGLPGSAHTPIVTPFSAVYPSSQRMQSMVGAAAMPASSMAETRFVPLHDYTQQQQQQQQQ